MRDMDHGIVPGFALLILLVGVGPALAQESPDSWQRFNSASAGDRRGCQDLSILVREAGGVPIADAIVTVAREWEVKTDSNGMAVLRCQAAIYYPAVAEISAFGYKPIKTTVNPVSGFPIQVDLERAGGRSYAGSGTTVNAGELSPDVRGRSHDLQTRASQAVQNHDYETAKQLLKEALELTPSSSAICNNLGVAYLRSRDLDTAAAWFEKAVKAAPRDAALVENLGLVRWMQHRGDESYELLSRAEAMGFESPGGNYALGVSLLQRGYTKRAIQHLKKVPAPKFPYRDLYLSIALGKDGKDKASQEAFQNFLKHVPVYYLYFDMVALARSPDLIGVLGDRPQR